MQEPRIHSRISPMLPTNHWLAGQDWICHGCSAPVYVADTGTYQTWVEVGAVTLEHDPDPDDREHIEFFWEPYIWCMGCFATNASTFPQMHPGWGLTDEGGPQLEDPDAPDNKPLRALIQRKKGDGIPRNPYTSPHNTAETRAIRRERPGLHVKAEKRVRRTKI